MGSEMPVRRMSVPYAGSHLRKIVTALIAGALAIVAVPGTSEAQQRLPTHEWMPYEVSWGVGQASPTSPDPDRPPSLIEPIANGIMMGVLGSVGGFLVVGYLTDNYGVAHLGAIAGHTLLMPVGVHYGNHARGSLGRSMATSGGVAAVGVGVAYGLRHLAGSSEAASFTLTVTPLAQLITSLVIERQ
jgi:hypothetical protein